MKASVTTFIAVVAMHIALAYGLSQVAYHPAATSPKRVQMINIVPTPLPVADTPTQSKIEATQPNIKTPVKAVAIHTPRKRPITAAKKPHTQPLPHILAVTQTQTTPAQMQPPPITPNNTAEASQQIQTSQAESPSSTSTTTKAIASATPVLAQKPTQQAKGETTAVNAETAYLSNPKPEYPAESKDNGEEGIVHLSVKVSTTGTVLDTRVHKSSGYINLDRAAIKAVKHWRFNPAKKEGIAVEAQAIVPIKFFIQ